jgi:radical SAM family protein
MVDVLLAHSNHLFHDRKQAQKMQPYPPLQTLLAAALLRENGISVALCDVTLDPPEEKFEALLDSGAPRMLVVCEGDFNFLTKMCLGRNRELSFRMAQMARERGIPAAVHGSDSSDHVPDYLGPGFGYVLIGEVEATLLELAQGKPPAQIDGLALADPRTGQPRFNSPRMLRTDLDSIPFPAWDLVDIDRYLEAWNSAHGFFSLNIVSSRGCPYRCNWCAKPIRGDNYHARSPRLVAEEMLRLKRDFRPDHFWFADDIFALAGQWMHDFAAAVESLGARTPFKMQSRCDLMTEDRVRALQRSGCSEVWMGAESGSQRILDAMDKGIRVWLIFTRRAKTCAVTASAPISSCSSAISAKPGRTSRLPSAWCAKPNPMTSASPYRIRCRAPGSINSWPRRWAPNPTGAKAAISP